MRSVLAVVTAALLVTFIGVHAVLLVALARKRPHYHAVVALAVPPLAPYWAWQGGVRRWVIAWGATLVLYTVAVAIILR